MDARQIIFSKPLPDIARMMRIVQIVAERQRQVDPKRGVLPLTVQAWLDEYRAEQTVRRDMVMLARAGFLQRVGDGNKAVATRRGYRVAHL